MKQHTILNDFIKYASLNVLGMIGLSCYILADTFFISEEKSFSFRKMPHFSRIDTPHLLRWSDVSDHRAFVRHCDRTGCRRTYRLKSRHSGVQLYSRKRSDDRHGRGHTLLYFKKPEPAKGYESGIYQCSCCFFTACTFLLLCRSVFLCPSA